MLPADVIAFFRAVCRVTSTPRPLAVLLSALIARLLLSYHPNGVVACRNVHPTTRLLQAFAGSQVLPPGILLISSRGVLLCTCTTDSSQQSVATQQDVAGSSSAAAAVAAAGAGLPSCLCVRKLQVLQWTLRGLPLSCVAVSSSCYVVGDDRAGEHTGGLCGASMYSMTGQTHCGLAWCTPAGLQCTPAA